MKNKWKKKLLAINKSLKAPQDAQAIMEQGKNYSLKKSIDGQQYDVASLLKAYKKQEYNSEIRLNAVYVQPIKEDNPLVKDEEKKSCKSSFNKLLIIRYRIKFIL
ncbi:hypothetical protein GCM10020331_054410 [Ectobacillus funiculus]